MKKIYLFMFVCFLVFMMSGNVAVKAESTNSFTNLEGVTILESDLEILNLLGYSYDDIMHINQEKIDNIRSINPSSNFYLETYCKSIYEVYNEEINVSNIAISKETFENEIAELLHKEEEHTVTRSVTNPSTYDDTEYKHIVFAGVYDSEFGALGKFTLRLSLEWRLNPKKRMTDVIGISNADNVQITSEVINNKQHPNFDLIISYKEVEYSNYESISTQMKTFQYNGSNVKYYTDLDEGISVFFDMPQSPSNAFEGDSDTDGNGYTRSNIKIVLETSYIPKNTGINATSFSGFYMHQTNSFSIDFDKMELTLYLGAPYITLEFSGLWNPKYDGSLGLTIYFEELYNDEDDNVGTC